MGSTELNEIETDGSGKSRGSDDTPMYNPHRLPLNIALGRIPHQPN